MAAGAQIRGALPMELAPGPLAPELKQNIRLLGMLDLSPFKERIPALVELSGLAWDADEKVLYAISDRGYLIHLKPHFADGRLADVTTVAHYALRNRHGQPLKGKAADAEGLTAVNQANAIPGDTHLLIAYERQHRIDAHRPDGTYLHAHRLPPALSAAGAYRSRNKGMEALAVHPQLGLAAAPEWPLRGTADTHNTLYFADGTTIALPRLDARNAGLVAMEALPDGRLLILERAHSWLTLTLIVTLRISEPVLKPMNSKPMNSVPSREVARFDSALGWRVDNFEGLSRHEDNKFFLVSDDNGSGLQKTLLLYFEIP